MLGLIGIQVIFQGILAVALIVRVRRMRHNLLAANQNMVL
jgi:hypothetical protein